MLSTLPLFYIAQSVNSDDRRTRIQGLRVIIWLHAEREEHVDKIKDGEASGKLLVIKLDSWTGHNQWDK